MMKCCFDKRVWIGIRVLAVGPLVIDPHAGRVGLRMQAGLACPLSMLVMTRGMRQDAPSAGEPGGRCQASIGRAADITRLRREVEPLNHHASEPEAPARDERAAGAGPREAQAYARRHGDSGVPG